MRTRGSEPSRSLPLSVPQVIRVVRWTRSVLMIVCAKSDHSLFSTFIPLRKPNIASLPQRVAAQRAKSIFRPSFKRFGCGVNRKKSKFECYGLISSTV